MDKIQKTGLATSEWQFVNISIVATTHEMRDIMNKQMGADAKAGTGLFANVTDIPHFNEAFDELLDVEKYAIKCSLQPYYRDLEGYGVANIFSAYDGMLYTMQFLKGLIDFIKENDTKPQTIRNKIADTVKSLDNVPSMGLLHQILILQGLCYWCSDTSEKIQKGNTGYNDVLELWGYVEKLLGEKEVRFCHYPWGDGDKQRLTPLCDFLYSTELGQSVQRAITPKSNTQTEPQQLPKELDTPEFRAILQKAVLGGFIEDNNGAYRWVKSKSLLAYFVDLLCDKLSLMHGEKRQIKPFEKLFGVSNISRCIADYQKTGALPIGHKDIDELVEY